MIVKIEVYVSVGYVGCDRRDIITVYLNGDETPEELEKAKEDAAREWMHEQIEWGWKDPKSDNE